MFFSRGAHTCFRPRERTHVFGRVSAHMFSAAERPPVFQPQSDHLFSAAERTHVFGRGAHTCFRPRSGHMFIAPPTNRICAPAERHVLGNIGLLTES